MLKNLSKVIELGTEEEWRVDRRTRGQDVENGPGSKPTQTWVLILSNKEGHRRFVPEGRVWEFYRPADVAPSK
jgi:hypothetical protein